MGVLTAVIAGWQLIISRRTGDPKPETSPKTEPLSRPTANAKRDLVFGVYPYPPLLIGKDKAEDFTGIWIDLGKVMAKALGRQCQFRLFTMGDLPSDTAPPVDIALAIFRTEERKKRFDFSRAIHRIGLQGICAVDMPEMTPEALISGDFRIVVQEGEVGWEYAKKELHSLWERKKISVVKSLDLEETMSLLASGTYDVTIHDELTCAKFLNSGQGDRFRFAFDRPLKIFDVAAAINPSSGIDMDEVNAALLRRRNEPSFRETEIEALAGLEKVVQRAGIQLD